MKRKTAGRLFVGIFTFALVTNAQAVSVLDQQFTTGTDQFRLEQGRIWQQGVTAGKSGLLSEVEVFYDGNLVSGDGGFKLFLNLGSIGGPLVFDTTVMLTPMDVLGWINVDVTSANVNVVSKKSVFFIGLEGLDVTGSLNPFVRGDQGGGNYQGGSLFENGREEGTWDFNFRTYVGQAIPEPTTLLLLTLGLAVLRFALRRSTRVPGSRLSAA